ncbi:hypothetical protein AAFH68_17570 [Flavobacterium sp. CGRL1]|jgi:hypothetical protein
MFNFAVTDCKSDVVTKINKDLIRFNYNNLIENLFVKLLNSIRNFTIQRKEIFFKNAGDNDCFLVLRNKMLI